MITPRAIAERLGHVYDPELGVDIISLGLVYDIDIHGDTVRLLLTMTTPGCPMATAIVEATRDMVEQSFHGAHADVLVTYDPPWHPLMMNMEAKALLGMA